MINEDKVKRALFTSQDMTVKKTDSKNRCHHITDGIFIWKEVLKSFFTGTLAFTGLTVLAVFTNAKQLLADINKIDFQSAGVMLGLIYIAFMLAYIMITIIVYAVRYKTGRKKARQIYGTFKTCRKDVRKRRKIKAIGRLYEQVIRNKESCRKILW